MSIRPGRIVRPLVWMMFAPAGTGTLSTPADRRDAVAPDHDHRVLDRSAAPAVDQRAALEHEHGLLRRECSRAEHAEQHREKSHPHSFLL